MYLAMLVEISWSIVNNLRVLKAQLLALRALGVELTIHTVFGNGAYSDLYWLFLACHQLMELVVAIIIGYTFRAQPFNVLFQQVQQVAAELADQMLPSITTIEVKPDMLQGDNLIAWRSDLHLG